jgi:hydrogenase expression/formation protein HypC
MCLSIPMQVVAWEGESGDLAMVEREQHEGNERGVRREQVNMMLIGPQPVGTWILASLGLAREVIDDAQRALIEDALAALSASLDDDYDPSQHFADLRPDRSELH